MKLSFANILAHPITTAIGGLGFAISVTYHCVVFYVQHSGDSTIVLALGLTSLVIGALREDPKSWQ